MGTCVPDIPKMYRLHPSDDAQLQICQHSGPTCCTRKMEESYKAAAQRETLQNIAAYSYEVKYLLTSHATAFQGEKALWAHAHTHTHTNAHTHTHTHTDINGKWPAFI